MLLGNIKIRPFGLTTAVAERIAAGIAAAKSQAIKPDRSFGYINYIFKYVLIDNLKVNVTPKLYVTESGYTFKSIPALVGVPPLQE